MDTEVKNKVSRVTRGSLYEFQATNLAPKSAARHGAKESLVCSFQDLYGSSFNPPLDRQHPSDQFVDHVLLKNEGIGDKFREVLLVNTLGSNRTAFKLLDPNRKGIISRIKWKSL